MKIKKVAIIIGLIVVLVGVIFIYNSKLNEKSSTISNSQNQTEDQIHIVYVQNRVAEMYINETTGKYYIIKDGIKWFLDEDEMIKNNSKFTVFSNGQERRISEEGEWKEYILPYSENVSVNYDVVKVVYAPTNFVVYYWNNNSLTTLTPSENDVVTAVRSNKTKLVLVNEYHDNSYTIKYWMLSISPIQD